MSNIDSSDVLTKTQFIMPITPRPSLCFTHGKGHYLFDQEGRAYLDMVQGWAVNTLGHCPEVIQKVLNQQSATLINPGPAFYNAPMLNLAETLCENSVFDQAFFASSGAEANEGAIKLARKWGQKHKQGAFKIITFKQGFHGRTLATMSATGKAAFDPLFEPKVSGFSKVEFNNLNAVEAAIDTQTTAIMLELVQGEAGVIPADKSFAEGVAALCRKHNLLLIVDEVQTGIGRCGTLFAYTQYGIDPDILTLGKGLGGGVPISALLTKHSVSCFDYGDQGGTFNGNPLMCAVAEKVVSEVLSCGFLQQSQASGAYLKDALLGVSDQFSLGEVRGTGLLLAMDTQAISATSIYSGCLERGLILNAPNTKTLRFVPALNITPVEIDQAIEILGDTLCSLR